MARTNPEQPLFPSPRVDMVPLDHPRPTSGIDSFVSGGAVEAEQIRLLLQNPADVPVNLINAGLVGIVVWPLYPLPVLALWLGLVCVVSLVRALMRHRYSRATGEAKTSPNWARDFTVNAFVAGCLWGLSASVILMTPDPIYYNFIVFVLGGTMAGGIVCIAVNLRAMLAFILPTILPAVVALAVHGGLLQIEMAAMLALFTCALVWTGRSINRSITENIRLRFAQEAMVIKMRSSEAAMAASQAIAHVGTWVIDLKSKTDVWSAETYRIFGVDPAAFKPSFEALLARTHPDDRKATSQDYEMLLATGTSQGFDHRIVMDDGAIKHVHELGKAICNPEGHPVAFIGTVQDVTERMRGEAASALLAAIVNSSDDAIISETIAGTIVSWNHGAEQLFGYRADEAIGQSVRIIIPAGKHEEIDRNLAMLAHGKRIDPFDTERLRKDGIRVPVSIAVSLIRDAAQSPVGASFIARDITERQVAAEALAYRDRLLHAVTVGTGTLVKAQSLDLGMPEALRVVGEGMRVDRVLVTQAIAGSGTKMALRYCWEVANIQIPIAGTQFPADALGPLLFAAGFEPLIRGKLVIAHSATSKGPVQEMLHHLGNKSLVLVPIFVGDVFWGALSADACATARQWTTSEIDTLRTFADIAGALIQRTEAQHLLETSEARFRAVTATAQDAIIAIDAHARIGLWNRAAERILGYSAEEAAGKQVHELLAPSRFRAKADSSMDAFLATGMGDAIGKTTELTALRKDGTEIAIELSLAAARLGDSWGAVGVLRDITKRKNAENKLQFANVLLQSEMEASPHGILVVDPGRKIVLFNQRFADIWQIPPAELNNGTLETALLRAKPLMPDPETFIARANHLFDHPMENSRDEYVLTDGRIIDRDIVTLSSGSGEHLGRVWYFRDITERRKADDKLVFANLLFRTQMEASLDGILIVDENKMIVAFNQRFATLWKIPAADLAAGLDDAVLAAAAASVTDSSKLIAGVQYLYDHPGEDTQYEFETTDGRSIDRNSVTLYSPSRVYLGRAWFFRDITERKRVEALALRMARYDVLTGLANRAVFVEAVQNAIAAAKRGESSFAVLYLDLDRFKDVNDTLGHPAGDELLKAVAARLSANVRETDTIARFGGDEFAIIAANIHDPADAAILADKLLTAFEKPFSVQGSDIHSGASIGIATYDAESPDAESLLSNADVALYRSKAEGRGAYRFFTNAMDVEIQARVRLGAELRIAIEANQLFLMYQPQVEIGSGRITGLEALVRWHHPTRGVLGPDLFIPVAEQIGIVAKLGHWVLWEACRQGKAWLDAGIAPSRIAVNLSALQFRTPVALEADIAAALAQTGFPPPMLELELTESVLMDASHTHSDVLRRLGASGITIAIDDFGTGYSSLEYLRRYPSNRIKIAQNFVTNLVTTPGDAAIVRATIGLARELSIDVIAEGVETQQQCDLLKQWGCDEVQGFHFAQPLGTGDATIALRAGRIVPWWKGIAAMKQT